MPYKQFTPVTLTASDVNTYLMNQSVITFANAAARTAALPLPTEGMVTYLQDTKELEIYNGTTWLRAVVTNDDERIEINNGGGEYAYMQYNSIGVYQSPTSQTFLDPFVMYTDGWMVARGQPRFLVYTGGYNHTGGAWLDISTLGGAANRTVAYNVGSGWSTSTGLFTAPLAGYYLFYAGGWANYNGAGNRYAISFHINANVGGDWVYISGANTSAVDSPLAMSPVVRYMAQGQYMRTAMFSSVAMQLGTSSHKFYYGGYLLG